MKNIVIIGAGNVGTFLAAAILKNSENHNLVIVEKDQSRLEQIRQNGVGYEAGNNNAKIEPEKFGLANSMENLGCVPDAVFIATKSYELTPEVYQNQIAPFLAENSKVVLVQNGYPNPEILQAIGEKAVIMVVNAGFSLDASGTKAVTNRSQIDLPYGSLSREVSGEELRSVVGDLFLGNSPELSVRFDENIIEDVLKKTQYACIGAYCVVEAFKNSHPENEKFKFGKLSQLEATNSQIGINISDISAEVVEVAGFNLLSLQELRDRLKINENIESSIVADARSSSQMERGIVDNLLELGSQKNLSLPALNKLSQALQLIERTGWNLTEENIAEVKNLYAVSLETPSSVTENSVVQSLKNNGLQLTK